MPILVLDFDGVCTTYASGWQGVDCCPDPPVEGLAAFLAAAVRHFDVQIHSSRSQVAIGREAMQRWFHRWLGPETLQHVTFPEHKPPAMLTLDDRALTFTGVWPDVATLLAFQPWTRNSAPPHERPPEPAPSPTPSPAPTPSPTPTPTPPPTPAPTHRNATSLSSPTCVTQGVCHAGQP